jgi:hypothetical protein
MLEDPEAGLDRISAHLDALDHAGRVAALTLGRRHQALLYQKAANAPPIGLDHLVPQATPREEVIHDGWNSLPLQLSTISRFQKRFARAEDGSPRLFGYNEGALRPLIGPGYFVAYPCQDHPTWASRGSVVVDYFQVPDGPVPQAWPKVRSNRVGLQIFVFNGTRDFLRGVGRTVSIGAAYKGETSLGQFFVLIRQT